MMRKQGKCLRKEIMQGTLSGARKTTHDLTDDNIKPQGVVWGDIAT